VVLAMLMAMALSMFPTFSQWLQRGDLAEHRIAIEIIEGRPTIY